MDTIQRPATPTAAELTALVDNPVDRLAWLTEHAKQRRGYLPRDLADLRISDMRSVIRGLPRRSYAKLGRQIGISRQRVRELAMQALGEDGRL